MFAGPRAKYFPVRPELTQSISILSYDHRAFPFFFFSGNKIRYRNVHLRRSFWLKSWDLNSYKVSSHLAKSRTRSYQVWTAFSGPARAIAYGPHTGILQ